jgi:hypothetical protein
MWWGVGVEVYKGNLLGGRLVVVKRLNCGPQAEEELLNDIGMNTYLSHPCKLSLSSFSPSSVSFQIILILIILTQKPNFHE